MNTKKTEFKKNNSSHKNLFSSLHWIFFVSRRFSRVDRKGRSAVTSFLASLGICFGVMTLIVVISVMNGFQMSFIDSIMEISSYHLRVENVDDSVRKDFLNFCEENNLIVSCTPFYEAQSLSVGKNLKQTAVLVRAVPKNVFETDSGFKKEMQIWAGEFDLNEDDSIVVGSEVARRLGVRVGSHVNLFALSGGTDVDLFSSDRNFTVTGIFRSGYADINATYAFINLEDGKKYFGSAANLIYGLKLTDTGSDSRVISILKEKFPSVKIESWKSYNRSFFGALRVEKNMLMLLVFLIFVVVGINIFNGMRRIVYERREEISVLAAFGGKKSLIQSIFVMQGFLTGAFGAIPGLALGLLISSRMADVFRLMAKIVHYFELFFTMLTNPQYAMYLRENPMFRLYANIPPRIVPTEILLITVFGIFSSLFASWNASRAVLKMTVAEVMRDE